MFRDFHVDTYMGGMDKLVCPCPFQSRLWSRRKCFAFLATDCLIAFKNSALFVPDSIMEAVGNRKMSKSEHDRDR